MAELEKALPRDQYCSVLRMLKKASLEKVNVVRSMTYSTIKRLGVKRDLTAAIKGIPKGSDQTDPMSIKVWMDRIKSDDTEAIQQVIAIDATACKRTSD